MVVEETVNGAVPVATFDVNVFADTVAQPALLFLNKNILLA